MKEKFISAKAAKFLSLSLFLSLSHESNIDQYCLSYLYELESSEHWAAEIPLRFKFVPLEFRREIRRRVSFLRQFN